MSASIGQKLLAVLALVFLAAPAGLCTLIWLTPALSTHGSEALFYWLIGVAFTGVICWVHQDAHELGGRVTRFTFACETRW